MTRRENEVDVVNPYSFLGLMASRGLVPGAVSGPIAGSGSKRRYRRRS